MLGHNGPRVGPWPGRPDRVTGHSQAGQRFRQSEPASAGAPQLEAPADARATQSLWQAYLGPARVSRSLRVPEISPRGHGTGAKNDSDATIVLKPLVRTVTSIDHKNHKNAMFVVHLFHWHAPCVHIRSCLRP